MINICDIYRAKIPRSSSVILIGPGLEEHIRGISEIPARVPYDPGPLFFATYLKGGTLHLFDRPELDYASLQNFFDYWRKLGTRLCTIRFIPGDMRLQADRRNLIEEGDTKRKDVVIIDHLTFSRHIAPYIIFDLGEKLYPPQVDVWQYFAQIYKGLLGMHSGKIIMHFEDSHWQVTLRERMKKAFSSEGCSVKILEGIEDSYRLDDEHIWEMVERRMIESARFNLQAQQIVPTHSSKSILIAEPILSINDNLTLHAI